VDPEGAHGSLNHLAFALQTRDVLTRAADMQANYDPANLQTASGRHGLGRTFFLYTIESGGNCIEISTPETLILTPDWEPVRWLNGKRATMYWGSAPVQAAFAVLTPPIEKIEAAPLSTTVE
jgi:hypothetical protein